MLSIPNGQLLENGTAQVLTALQGAVQRGVSVLMKCGDWNRLPEGWKSLGYAASDADVPLALPDDDIAWCGMPLAQGSHIERGRGLTTVVQTPVRLTGANTLSVLGALADLESCESEDGKKTTLRPKNDETRASASKRVGRACSSNAQVPTMRFGHGVEDSL